MSGNPSQPSNVVPMPTNWPGPMFAPKTFPPGGPSCFSELAALNACYDSIQMMNQILSKVITDLVTNDKAVQAAIVAAIAASGSNVPLIGVTNGADAQPGQVGEFMDWSIAVPYTAANQQQVISVGTLPPGDWDLGSEFGATNLSGGVFFALTPQPPGFSTDARGTQIDTPTTSDTAWTIGLHTRALISVPSLLAFTVITNFTNSGTNVAGTGDLGVWARRRR